MLCLQVGDPIQITYLDTGEMMSSVSKFTNNNVKSKAINFYRFFDMKKGKCAVLDVCL